MRVHDCPYCICNGREPVINRDAPFYPLVMLIDRITHEGRRPR